MLTINRYQGLLGLLTTLTPIKSLFIQFGCHYYYIISFQYNKCNSKVLKFINDFNSVNAYISMIELHLLFMWLCYTINGPLDLLSFVMTLIQTMMICQRSGYLYYFYDKIIYFISIYKLFNVFVEHIAIKGYKMVILFPLEN